MAVKSQDILCFNYYMCEAKIINEIHKIQNKQAPPKVLTELQRKKFTSLGHVNLDGCIYLAKCGT